MKIKNILVVGGAGYIGSHMSRLLVDQGYRVAIFDNDYNPRKGKLPKVRCIKGDLRNFKDIQKALKSDSFDLIMYFAGLIIAPESVIDPIKYYEHNVLGAINLIKAVQEAKVNRFIFSSTAAVYGNPKRVPIQETSELQPINPYGNTKLVFENILKDFSIANPKFSYIGLRYFNAAGAHYSGELGECHEPETHLIPNILKAIKGEIKELKVFGDDYKTPDGTCIRDYIHVEDLTEAHYLAIKALDRGVKNDVFNLGSGKGYSIKEIIKTVEEVTGKKVPYQIVPRRPGDPAKLIASYAKAKKVLSWKPSRNLKAIVESAWMWEKRR